jgi:hypothetical protein
MHISSMHPHPHPHTRSITSHASVCRNAWKVFHILGPRHAHSQFTSSSSQHHDTCIWYVCRNAWKIGPRHAHSQYTSSSSQDHDTCTRIQTCMEAWSKTCTFPVLCILVLILTASYHMHVYAEMHGRLALAAHASFARIVMNHMYVCMYLM